MHIHTNQPTNQPLNQPLNNPLTTGKLPLMEIVFLLEREEFSGVAHRGFTFKSVYGMPIKGELVMMKGLGGYSACA